MVHLWHSLSLPLSLTEPRLHPPDDMTEEQQRPFFTALASACELAAS